jgi:NNP family nitrate/nitrite transporter-like MFS transporter
MNTLAFTVCFAVWMMYGVLITYLVSQRVYDFDKSQIGWLIGTPVLTGALFRLPVGVLTDKYGGRIMFVIVMLIASVGAYATSMADSFWGFFAAGLLFGMSGATFAVGIAYTSVWFGPDRQGIALGIFGAGNAGAAITSLGAPTLLKTLTDDGQNVEAWRTMPKIYALGLVTMTVLFWFLTFSKKVEHGKGFTLSQRLAPLKQMRVWRFGLYYFFVFGGFVALAQWLIPYYVNVYSVSVATAGYLASIFTLPSGVIRAFGGWLSDKFGARRVMYWVLGGSSLACFLLVIPRMDVYATGEGVMAAAAGEVSSVSDTHVQVGEGKYSLAPRDTTRPFEDDETRIMPARNFWQEPVVKPGDQVVKKQLLARGVTHIHFQANIWIFTAIAFVIGILMGIGKAAVYKHIPMYFPKDVGVVGGIVGVLGGLGGFFCPILFGYLLSGTGIWTTCWIFFFLLSTGCLIWMHHVIRNMLRREAPDFADQMDVPAESS